ncbi:DUF6069 family protein [Pseudonocardia bannensis]|uniref:DUF6069 family protein n=1 Tax=Pseudonocardia bannensis TaxID=630973 RepID=UPI001FE36844|nr:DUF6069 family protein [Pseudonocardia bannensis]
MASGYNERGGSDPDYPDYAEPTRQLGRRPAGATPALNAGRLWSGGVATAVVAALIGLVGLLVVRALLQIPYLAPAGAGALGDSRTIVLCMSAAIAALAATGLAHLLLVSTPRPMAYFGWIVGLLTAVAVVLPFLDSEPLTVRVATAIIHLVVGIAIGSLVTGAAVSATGGRAAA